jgi:hypothetical protein
MTTRFDDVVGGMNWFIGVVEDRNDPEQIGRLRVRVIGDHTDDRSRIPTRDLPWAQVIMPITSASLAGIGDSATGIVQGSWVVGFYIDGEAKQQPMILGTIPGITSPSNSNRGFADPQGVHPVRIGEPDTPYSAMGAYYQSHGSYITRVDTRVDDVDCAVPPRVTSVAGDEPDTYYERPTWSSPQVQNGRAPDYPYNKVRETESGHVFETDDTPGNERIAQFHRSGTNYEIQRDGTKTETIVGDNYTVVLGTDNIYIRGNVNLTIDGDYRQLVKGNYHLEVNGNKTEQIRGSRQTKINNNENMEVMQDFAYNVTGNYIQRTGGNETRIVDGFRNTTIGANEDLTVTGDMSHIVLGDINAFAAGNHATTSMGTLTVTSQGNITVATPSNLTENVNGNVTETYGGNQTTTVTGNMDLNATRIDLN